jgi:hypothetical protein
VHPRIPGDFRSFLCTATGYGHVNVRDRKATVAVASGRIDVDRIDFVPFGIREP